MSSKGRTAHEEALDITEGKSGLWGWLAGLVVLVLVALPLSAAFAFATNPHTQQLFSGRLEEVGAGAYQTFWWIVTLFLVAVPILVGYVVANLSAKSLAIAGAIIALFVIAIIVLGQMYIF
ncbi:hypothetical protein MUN74_07835 [Agromyces endophyticus]|uniref:hypothetical protein n=1 Tax=Agromyces sp. H17E-10 TaxID=2932244 RepID=UPI001FD0E8F1|nr:hypothetical protein [Agromyces sp. H17E-10]UOQ90800.1 hypothetical protein MUN74_07835 [Agromyces sp. H17E-10]